MTITEVPCTIASGAATSGIVDLIDKRLVGISIPSTFDGTTLAVHAAVGTGHRADNSYDDLTFLPVYDVTNTAVSWTVAAGHHIVISPLLLAGVRFVRFVAGSNQSTTDTQLTLVLDA